MSTSRGTLAVGAAALAVAGGSGAAIAASQGSSASPEAFVDSLAEHLGVSTDELEDAAKAAAIDQVDAALADGRITAEQAEELKERIEAGGSPLLLGPPLFGGPDVHRGAVSRRPRRGCRVPRAPRGRAARADRRRAVPRRDRACRRQVGGRPGAGPSRRGRGEPRRSRRGQGADARAGGRDPCAAARAHRRLRQPWSRPARSSRRPRPPARVLQPPRLAPNRLPPQARPAEEAGLATLYELLTRLLASSQPALRNERSPEYGPAPTHAPPTGVLLTEVSQ
jgi:hypothetical protein